MDILSAIHTRRSIRSFTDAPVSEEAVKVLLDAAMIAPSAGNAQPWRFIVVDDPALLAQVPAINPYAAMAPKAPLAILVCGDTRAEKYPGYWVQDCSAAIQNMLLAALSLGLGTVWTGIHPMQDRVEAFQALHSLPEGVIPLGLVIIGHPAMGASHKSRYDAAKVHRNTWQE